MAENHPQYKDRPFNLIFGSEENRALKRKSKIHYATTRSGFYLYI